MAKLSVQVQRKIMKQVEPEKCDQCDETLPNDIVGKEYFISNKNWSGVAMVYCRGCEDRRADKFDDVEDCVICGDVVVEDEIVWYNAEQGRLDTDKGDPYCVGCVPQQEYV